MNGNGNLGDFLGVGWAYPVGVDTHGRVALARHEEDIKHAIRMILLTPKGQRVMRPEFGSRLHELVFAANDVTTAGRAAYFVQEALGMWEPRIDLEDVSAAPDPTDANRLLIEIRYEISATHDQRSLVFPFYTIPAEEAR
jgi:uncharacterized protein